MKEDQNIEDLFRASFEEFEVTPPSSVKAAIDSQIQGGKRKRIWWISSVVLLLFLATGGWFLIGTAGTGTTSAKTTQSASVKNPEGVQQLGSNEQHGSESFPNEAVTTSGKQQVAPESNAFNGTTHPPKSPKNTTVFTKKKEQYDRIAPKNKRPKSYSEYTDYIAKKKLPKKEKGILVVSPPDEEYVAATNKVFESDFNGTKVNGNPTSPVKKSGKAAVKEMQTPVSTQLAERAQVQPHQSEAETITVQSDSNQVTKGTAGKDDKMKPATDPEWMVSVFAGPQWGINAITEDPAFEFKEKPSLYFSAEISRNLFKGFGVTTGAGFHARSENMTYNQFSYDSVYVGMDSTAITDPNNTDSIIGYDYFDVYQIDTTKVQQTNNYSFQSVTVPLFINRHFSFTEQWGMLVNAGAVFQFNNIKNTKENVTPAPLPNRFTISPMLRVHATYTVNNWMFSAGLNTGIDLRNAIDYSGIDRKRFFLTPQFGVHFRF